LSTGAAEGGQKNFKKRLTGQGAFSIPPLTDEDIDGDAERRDLVSRLVSGEEGPLPLFP
jgi:hypothetical protein